MICQLHRKDLALQLLSRKSSALEVICDLSISILTAVAFEERKQELPLETQRKT